MPVFLRWRLIAVAVLLCSVYPGLSARDPSAIAVAQTVGEAEVVPHRFIVRLQANATASARQAAGTYDAMPGVAIDQVYTSAITGFAGTFTDAAVERLIDDPNVLDIRPDRKTYLAAQQVPPGIERVDAHINPTNAGDGSGAVDVDIAVLDTGIYKHPDLNVVGGKDCASTARSGPYNDISGHGTHVAGTAAAIDNGDGVVGVAPGARLWAIKIFSDDQHGAAYESEVTCGLDFVRANANAIEVINLSIGSNYGYDLGPCWADAYHQAYCNVVAAGVTVVVAAQNWTINARTVVPAQFDEVITVSAYYDSDGKRGGLGPVSDCTPRGGVKGVQKDDTFACFSNYGHDIDISAPGMDVYSTYSANADPEDCPSALYCYMSGTSMSTPHVAGAIGLIAAQQGRMSPSAMKARLLATAERGPVPLDPDGIDEPMLNVAQLGLGEVSLPSHAKVGERVRIDVAHFTPGERAIFRMDGRYLGGDTVDDDGEASREITIPATIEGRYAITVSTGQKAAKATLEVNPSLRLSVTSGPVGETVSASLRGFGSSESVLVSFDTGNGARSLIRVVTTQATGSANVSFVVPSSTYGKHRVSASGSQGNATYTSYNTKASAHISAGTPMQNALVRFQVRGFAAGEVIEARFDAQSGPVLGSLTASATGSGSVSVRIPADASPGTHYVWMIGSSGHKVRVPLSVTVSVAPTPEPTPSATSTGPAETPVATETVAAPTEPAVTGTATAQPSRTPAAPTETATIAPPTEAPSEIPTETPTDPVVVGTEPLDSASATAVADG